MSADLRARIYDLYTAFREGRIDFVVNYFDDRAVFTSHAPVDIFPYLGRQIGKAAIAETITKVHAEFEYVDYQPVFVVAEQNDAAVIVTVRIRQRTTDRVIQLLVAHFIRFEDGLIVEFREFMDSFDAVQQVLGRELDTAKRE